jgi:hypothetical protein
MRIFANVLLSIAATLTGASAQTEPSEIANARQRGCGAEWSKTKDTLPPGRTRPRFWGECNSRLAGKVGRDNSSAQPKQTFTDPLVYCKAVGTIDDPDKRYVGPRITEEMAATFRTRLSEKPVIDWRCSGGQVLACRTLNSPLCGKYVITVTAAMQEFCSSNPNEKIIPAAVAGHAPVEWTCIGTAPSITKRFGKLDSRGFDRARWKPVSDPKAVATAGDEKVANGIRAPAAELTSQPASQETTQPRIYFASDLAEVSPQGLSALQRVIPERFRRDKWVYALGGVAGPLLTTNRGGQQYHSGRSCKPHDCGANMFAFAVVADGSRAVGILSRNGQIQLFGSPDGEIASVLAAAAEEAGIHWSGVADTPPAPPPRVETRNSPGLEGIWKGRNITLFISRENELYVVVAQNPSGMVNGTFAGPRQGSRIILSSVYGDIAILANDTRLKFAGDSLTKAGN